jgi:hypothetical protein
VERSGTHGKRRVDDEKEGWTTRIKRGGGWMTHDNRRRVALEGDMTREGPMQAKHRATENDGIARVSLIRVLIS